MNETIVKRVLQFFVCVRVFKMWHLYFSKTHSLTHFDRAPGSIC